MLRSLLSFVSLNQVLSMENALNKNKKKNLPPLNIWSGKLKIYKAHSLPEGNNKIEQKYQYDLIISSLAVRTLFHGTKMQH